MSGPRWNAIQWVASVVALIVSIAAVANGFAPDRFRAVFAFATLWAVTASGAVIGRTALRRRAARLKGATVPRGVRLIGPFWIALVDVFEVFVIAGLPGAIAGGVGFSGVGIGIVVALAVMCIPLVIVEWLWRTDLTFESEVLQVHKRHFSFSIALSSILDVAIVPAANPALNVEIAEPHRLLATVEPDSPQHRRRLQNWLAVWSHSGRTLLFFPNWTAGLDSATLSRAISEAKSGPSPSLH